MSAPLLLSPRSRIFGSFATLALAACGARTAPEVGPASVAPSGTGGSSGQSAGGAGTSAGSAGAAGDAAPSDPCPSAVLGPKAMWKSCSTRDGRLRVSAPKAPLLRWSVALPTYDGKQLNTIRIASDASGHAYVVTSAMFSDVGDLRRVRASDGTVDWTSPLTPDTASDGVPLILATGRVDLFAYASAAASTPSVLSFDPASGSSAIVSFGLDLYDARADPAIGADGSAYLTHSTGVGTADPKTFVSRIRPDHSVAWTSSDLATLAPTLGKTDVSPSRIALGNDGRVWLWVSSVPSFGPQAVVLGLDAETGKKTDITLGLAQPLGGPLVRPDGKIVILVAAVGNGPPNLVVIDPGGGEASIGLGAPIIQLFGVTRDGLVLAGVPADGTKPAVLLALDANGLIRWTTTTKTLTDAMIAADGTVVIFGGVTIVALDPTDGTTKWSFAAPHAGSYIGDLAITSDGWLVGLQGDGTLFGAAD